MSHTTKGSAEKTRCPLRFDFCLTALSGGVILAFGLYNVHAQCTVTEGGVLGMTLLLEHWFSVSPALSGFFLNLIFYGLGFSILGKSFLFYSFVGAGAFSLAYRLFECFPPLWPGLSAHPLLASLLGALFVGIGAGLCVRIGSAPGGDDALALYLEKKFRFSIRWAYLLSDLTVLGLSLSYIPFSRMVYSLLTVLLSGQLVGLIEKAPLPIPKKEEV